MPQAPATPEADPFAPLGATPADRRRALGAVGLLTVALGVAAPRAGRPCVSAPAFVVGYDAAVTALVLVTALLLSLQYRQRGERSLLVLACGYLFAPVLAVAHAASIPGAFGPGTLVGGPQTAAWLWVGWHALFPLFVVGYAWLARRDRPGDFFTAGGAAVGSVAIAVAIVLLTTAGESFLPELTDGDRFRPGGPRLVLAAGGLSYLAALGALAGATRFRRRLDLGVAVALAAWLIDLTLSAVLTDGRDQLGWYLGRAFGLFAAGVVLGTLLWETAARAAARLRQAESLDRSGAAVRESEARLAGIFAHAAVGLSEVGLDGRFRRVNGALCRMLGRTEADLLALGFPDVTHPADVPPSLTAVARVVETGEPATLDKRCVRADGTVVFATHSLTRLDGPDGRPRAVLAVTIDLTGRRAAEADVRASEERLRLALAVGGLATWDWDLKTGAVVWNAEHYTMQGYVVGEVEPSYQAWATRVHPDDRPGTEAALIAARDGGTPYRHGFRSLFPDGSVRWLSAQGLFFYDEQGLAVRMIGVMQDVTAQRAAESALRTSEERLRRVVDAATDYAILTLDPLRRITSWSPGAAAVFGYTTREVLGRPADLLFTPEDRAAGVPEGETWEADRTGRAADERWQLRKDRSRFFASGVVTPYGTHGSLGYVKVLRDLTDRKRLEDDLRAARDRLEETVAARTAELSAAVEALAEEMDRRRELVRRLTTAQEDERRRVSRDLHDTAGQLLTGLSLAAAAGRLDQVRRLAEELGRELHGLAVRLRPTALDDVGLVSAVEQLAADWSARSGVPAEVAATGPDGWRLPTEAETALYRVVQEALTNVAKHARATRVSVVLTSLGGEVKAVVEDDGAGFDPAAVRPGRLGLAGMRERVELVGGRLEVESAPGAGTTVIAGIPVGPG